MFKVYILRNEKGKYYVGYTQDIEARLKKHNGGGSSYTRNKGSWEVIYVEEYKTKQEAYRREKQIKRYKGGEAFKNLVNKPYY